MTSEDKQRYDDLMEQADSCRVAAAEAISQDSFVKAREALDAEHAALRAANALLQRPTGTDPRCWTADTKIPR